MKIASLLSAAVILSLAASPLALAETAGTPGNAMAAASDAKAAKAKECIAEADAKGLHGKERKKFKHHCKKAK